MHITIPYTPQPHQLQWHNSTTKRLVAICGRQIGKTVAAVNELIKRALTNPGTRNWYVTNDYKQAKRNVWDLFVKYVPKELKAQFNNSELSIRFPNGSKIELIGVENAESLRGAAVHFMILDEYKDFPPHIWPEVLKPMFSTTSGTAWFLGTPKGFNHFYDLYVQAGLEGWDRFKIPACYVVDNKVTQVTSEYADPQEIQDAYDEDRTIDKISFNQEYLAEFTKHRGTVYSEWSLEHYQPLDYDPNLPLYVSWDFGVNDPTAIIWIQKNGGEYRVIDYHEESDGDISHFISVVNSKPYRKAEMHCGDPAGSSRELNTGTSPIEELRKSGIHVRTKTVASPVIPTQIRITHQIIPSLYVSSSNPNCERFRDILVNYRYPEKNKNPDLLNQSNEIPIHDEYSHGARALEYFAVNVLDLPQKVKKVIVGYTEGDPTTGFGRRPIYRTSGSELF